jgi:hypothetical protein
LPFSNVTVFSPRALTKKSNFFSCFSALKQTVLNDKSILFDGKIIKQKKEHRQGGKWAKNKGTKGVF